MTKIVFLIVFILVGVLSNYGQTSDACLRWRSQVDSSLNRIAIDNKQLTDEEVTVGIGCLLNLRGNRGKTWLVGATRTNLSSSDQHKKPKNTATIEVAALYYASYLFYQDWEHAGSVSLYDADTHKSNSRAIIKRAYESYLNWFKKVKAAGLVKARQEKLDPLEGSDVSWS